MPENESDYCRTYPTTHWSQIYLASQREQEAGLKALGTLLRQYSAPLMAHLQYKFRASEEAAREWLHGFIEQRILARQFLQQVDQRKGRFRSFLLNALDNFVCDDFRAQSGAQRTPPGGIVSIEVEEPQQPLALVDEETPLDPFEIEWARTILERARERTRQFYEQKGRSNTWLVFRDAALVFRKERPSSAELARRYGFESARQADNAVLTATREFGKQLWSVVAEYMDDPKNETSVEQEIRDLIRILSQPQFWKSQPANE